MLYLKTHSTHLWEGAQQSTAILSYKSLRPGYMEINTLTSVNSCPQSEGRARHMWDVQVGHVMVEIESEGAYLRSMLPAILFRHP